MMATHRHPRTTAPVSVLYEQARAAQQRWHALSAAKRRWHLRRFRYVIVERLDEVARRVAAGTGKVEAEVLVTELLPVLSALQFVEKHAAKLLRRRRRPTPIFLAGKRSYVEYVPKGVVLVIGPWNFPLQLALVPTIYALAAANAVVLKPSEVTPHVGELIEELVDAAHFPPHLIQVAHGAADLGAALVSPPASTAENGPHHIFFTGSVATGKKIQRAAAARLIPTTLELSGKDAMIVFADAPLERAVNGAVWGAFMNSGQVCVGVERVYVERGVYDEFARRMAREASRLKSVAPASPERSPQNATEPGADADLGAMTFRPQVRVVKEQMADALERGATIVHGRRPDDDFGGRTDHRFDDRKGTSVSPAILADVTPAMRIAREETFGPVVTMTPFDGEEEVIAMANSSEFGLNASVWSGDTDRAHRVAAKIEAGSVVINDVIVTLANEHLPFGGVKQSGLGKNHGEAGLKTFSHEKAVMRDLFGRRRDVHWFPYDGKAPLFASLLRSYFQPRRSWVGFLTAFIGLLRRSR